MLGRAEQLRLQLESSPNTKNPSTRPVTPPGNHAMDDRPSDDGGNHRTHNAIEHATHNGATTGPSTMPTTAPVPPPTTQPSPKSGFL